MEDNSSKNMTDEEYIEKLGDLAKRCMQGKYVLIVGSEVILHPTNHSDVQGDSMQWLLKRAGLITRREKQLKDELSKLKDELLECYTSLSQVSKEKSEEISEKINGLKKELSDLEKSHKTINELAEAHNPDEAKWKLRELIKNETTNNGRYDSSDFNPELYKLLQTRCFRVVITTAIDHHLEDAMWRIWGKELKVLNIYSDSKRDWDNFLVNNEFCDAPPTLYYVFGKLTSDKDEFVFSDDDAMKAIKLWGSQMRPYRLGHYISNQSADQNNKKNVLSIGCQLDNWQFRFFWYQLLGEHPKEQRRNIHVAMTWDENQKLKDYLDSFWDFSVEDNSQKFITCLSSAIYDRFQQFSPRQDYVFISYAKENQDRAYNLADRLKDNGFNVWIDQRLGADGKELDYKNRIPRAIENCSAFIALFTADVMESLKKGELNVEKIKEKTGRDISLDDKLTKLTLDEKNMFLNSLDYECFNRFFFFEWQFVTNRNAEVKSNDLKRPILLIKYNDFIISSETTDNILQEDFKISTYDTEWNQSIDTLASHLREKLNQYNLAKNAPVN